MKAYRLGKGGMTLAAVGAAAMCVLSWLFHPERPFQGVSGICLPSPADWEIPSIISLIINMALIGGSGVALWSLNRKYNFIRSTRPVLPAIFIVAVASNPWISSSLSTSVLLASVNIISLALLFETYDSQNATQQMFVVATFLSVGSMFQYAFIPMILVYLIGAVVLKIFRVKELAAFIIGLIAPYWVGLGFGWLKLNEFRLPEPSPLFNTATDPADLFFLLLNTGIFIFAGFVIAVSDSMKIYAGNSRVNALNSLIYWLGIVTTACIIIDFNNILAYLATLYLAVAVQFANLSALWQFKHDWLVTFIPCLFFIVFFILYLA